MRLVSSRVGATAEREPLFSKVEDGPVSLSVAQSVSGSMQVDVFGLQHGHVRFIVRLPLTAAAEVEMRVIWSPRDVKLFVDGRQLDEWRRPVRH